MARNALRSSTKHLCRVFGCPPGLRPSPPVIIANITRLGNHPLLCRTTAPAKKSRRLRLVVSMLSHRVFLSAFAYERVFAVGTLSVLKANNPTGGLWWCTVQSLAKCSTPRVHVTHPHNRVSATAAFNMRILRLPYTTNLVHHTPPRRPSRPDCSTTKRVPIPSESNSS